MKVYYVNSDRTKTVNLNSDGCEISDLDVFKHELQYTEENDKITKFNRGIRKMEMEVNITTLKTKSWKEIYEDIMQAFDKDALYATQGKLYVNDCYVNCYMYALEAQETFEDWGFQIVTMRAITDDPAWIQEETFQFLPPDAKDQEQAGTTKAYDYTYDACVYPTEPAPSSLVNDHYDLCDFRMAVYGPRSQTNITVGENVYHVNYAIQDGEYMVIDSRETAKPGERVYLVRKNGETLNLFDYRDPKYSIFAKIPPGTLPVSHGDTGIDITIFKRRSEPKWN